MLEISKIMRVQDSFHFLAAVTFFDLWFEFVTLKITADCLTVSTVNLRDYRHFLNTKI